MKTLTYLHNSLLNLNMEICLNGYKPSSHHCISAHNKTKRTLHETRLSVLYLRCVTSDPQELPCLLLSTGGRVQRWAGGISPVEAARLSLPQAGRHLWSALFTAAVTEDKGRKHDASFGCYQTGVETTQPENHHGKLKHVTAQCAWIYSLLSSARTDSFLCIYTCLFWSFFLKTFFLCWSPSGFWFV